MRHLILIRGLPGSGKSTLAREYDTKRGFFHYETDMYWLRPDGHYDFNRDRLKAAHEWCQQQVDQILQHPYGKVVVSNTFTRITELLPYVEMHWQRGTTLQIIECTGTWPSIHNVPDEVLQRMRDRWEPLPDNLQQYKVNRQ